MEGVRSGISVGGGRRGRGGESGREDDDSEHLDFILGDLKKFLSEFCWIFIS